MSPTQRRVRPPVVAGMFYPSNRKDLETEIERAFRHAVPADPDLVPRALVAPHAGYVYSGAIAASAFSLLEPIRHKVHRVVLLGPSHRIHLDGIGVTSVEAWDTPLGRVAIDDELRSSVLGFPWAHVNDRAHAPEHSLEVEVPFLQTVLDDFTLLPLVVGETDPAEVSDTIDAVWDTPETIVVVSTDLSHYLPHGEAVSRDNATARQILAMDPTRIGDHDACGCRPLRGLLRAAKNRGLTVHQLDLRNSGDTAGDKERVVGYGAFAVS